CSTRRRRSPPAPGPPATPAPTSPAASSSPWAAPRRRRSARCACRWAAAPRTRRSTPPPRPSPPRGGSSRSPDAARGWSADPWGQTAPRERAYPGHSGGRMSQLPEVEHFAAWMKGMRAAVEAGCAHAPSLESASQASAHAIFDGFAESAVLVRLFVTLPASDLPAGIRAEAEKLAACAPTTPVLTLLGTYGLEVEWRDRRQSRGHAAIPLVSSAFVSAIPMMARVLEELGADL